MSAAAWRAVTRLAEMADDLRDRADHWTPNPAERRYLRSIASDVDEVCGWLAEAAPDPPGDALVPAETPTAPPRPDHTRERDDCSCDLPGRCPRHDR